MACWFLGLVIVVGVAVKDEPSEEHHVYGGANVSDNSLAMADPYGADDGVSEPEAGGVAAMLSAFQAAGLGEYMSDDDGVEPVPAPKESPDIFDASDLETVGGYGVVDVEDGDAGDGVVPVEAEEDLADYAPSEVSEGEEPELVGEVLPPNPLGGFAAASQHIDVDLFALYAQEPGSWQRFITHAWRQACRSHHPDREGDHNRFLELTGAKEALMAWVAEFKDIKKSWPDSKAHCFCDKCRKLIQEMLQCEKCLGLKTNSAHVCGYFTKRFGIFMRTRTHKASILQLAALVAHGRSEEDAILELKAQLAEKEEAARTAAALEAELAQQQEKKRKADFQRTLAQRLHATRIKTEQEFSQKTGYQRHRQQIADTSNPSGSLDSGASRPAVVASMLAEHIHLRCLLPPLPLGQEKQHNPDEHLHRQEKQQDQHRQQQQWDQRRCQQPRDRHLRDQEELPEMPPEYPLTMPFTAPQLSNSPQISGSIF
ncbi:unnamed protein product [Symbiodinium microadriaticum]|nr:unnamed protein product [Symbiodinium microadriaticum]CAE7460051.1 unnamed protein product [Symbiodinium sp. KB8]